MKSILDGSFKYVPSSGTDLSETFRKNGFKPTTQAERRARNSSKGTANRPAQLLLVKGNAKNE